jgi:gamma-glutamyl:cysteine ligase YbdK (ATP-grasp superfamily)
MGIEIDRTQFSAEDFECFGRRLEENLADLRGLLDTPGFGEGPPSLGAELEIYIVDDDGNPLHANQEIHAAAADPRLTLELNRYNLEYNLTPGFVAEGAFSATEREIIECLGVLESLAADHGGRAVAIGILPTLRQSDFGPASITDRRRYHALVEQLIQRRGSAFRIDINGRDPLQLDMADITLEGANTSFQAHYRVAPEAFADTYNALQLATPLALAIAANSPTLFGHSLWRETRIPLFKQSIDCRQRDRYTWSEPARVNFGRGWVRRGAYELFEEQARVYPPLLPARADPEASSVPLLEELRLHLSTVWLWNRPVFDPVNGGHLRIEMRALPAGPSPVDMVANAAFLIGLAEGLRPRINRLLPALPFHIAEYNFYRAAQHGLDARLVWPREHQHGLSDAPVTDLIDECLPLAADGLAAIGTPREEIERYLGIIAARLASRRTGASWQLDMLHRLGGDVPGTDAFHEMLFRFMSNAEKNLPVAEWPL